MPPSPLLNRCNMVSDSRLAMWQSLVALVDAEDTFKDVERKKLEEYIQYNHLCPEQYSLLETELNKGITLKEVYSKITDVVDRANLLNMARVLFYTHGGFSGAEQKAYDAIYQDQDKAVDFHKVEAEANQRIADYKQQLLKEEQDEDAHEGRIERLFDYISGIKDLFEDSI